MCEKRAFFVRKARMVHISWAAGKRDLFAGRRGTWERKEKREARGMLRGEKAGSKSHRKGYLSSAAGQERGKSGICWACPREKKISSP